MSSLNIYDMLERYAGTGDAKFFSLKNDGDSAKVRILIDSTKEQLEKAPLEDLGVYPVHQIGEVHPKKSYLCTQTPDCKFCKEGNRAQLRIFIQLFDVKEGIIKIWERGRKDIERIIKLISKFGSLCALDMEIERNGKSGSKDTTYTFYPGQPDGKTLKDFPEKSKIVGTILAVARDGQEVAEELPPAPAPRKRVSEDLPF